MRTPATRRDLLRLLRVHEYLPPVDGVRKFGPPREAPALDLGAEVALLSFLLRPFRQQSEHGRDVLAQVYSSPNLLGLVPSQFIERYNSLLPRLLLDLLHEYTIAALEAHAGDF